MKKLKLDELNRVDVDTFKGLEKMPIVVVLDNVRSMHNVGSIFRTSDGFAIEKVILCGITAQPPHREIEKTALGATEAVEWEYYPTTLEAISELKKAGYLLTAIEQAESSTYIHEFVPDRIQKYALIFGNEVNGVAEEVMEKVDLCLEIPQFGTKHSFNIVISAGILLWDFVFKLKWSQNIVNQ